MRPLVISGRTAVQTLQHEIQRSEESRYDHRLHGVLLVAHGVTCPEVAALLGDAPRSVEYWVHRFQQKGLAGLQEGEHAGRPGRLDEKQMAAINRAFARKAKRRWHARKSLGWQNPVGVDRKGIRNSIGRPSMPASVPAHGLSFAQATTGSGQGRPGPAEAA